MIHFLWTLAFVCFVRRSAVKEKLMLSTLFMINFAVFAENIPFVTKCIFEFSIALILFTNVLNFSV